MLVRIILLLVLNFLALAVGSYFTATAVKGEWYSSLHKAPWTPPGWVFGFAWTLIMICFAFYISSLWEVTQEKKTVIILYTLQWVLNVSWNPLFFRFHQLTLALVVIILLTIVIGYILISYTGELRLKSLFIAPYFLWLLIATSLNAYICVRN